MREQVLNNEIRIAYPDSFHEMNDEECRKMNIPKEENGAVFFDPDRHAMVSVGWKTAGGFLSFVLSNRDLAKNMEKQIRRSMASFSYSLKEFKEKQIDDQTACGFSYEYTAQEVPMYGESYAVKDGKTIWYFHFYTRSALKDEGLSAWNSISVKWL